MVRTSRTILSEKDSEMVLEVVLAVNHYFVITMEM